MGFQPLQKWNGLYHLPFPRGRFLVGMTDLQTKDNLLVRCFYPTQKLQSPDDHYANANLWCKWLPSLEYTDGYIRFKFSKGIPLMARIFRFLLGDPLCPVATNASVISTENQALPVVIFSHGLGAMRSTYSILLTELASNGFFVAAVEHKDGSASATQNVDGSWMFNRNIKEGESEYEIRNAQVNQRVQECESTYDLLSKLLKEPNLDFFHPEPPSNFIESVRSAKLDLERNCFISGHSFGGATALKSIYTSKVNEQPMFKKALLFDTWMFPIRNEAEQLSKEGGQPCVHFINCERFQGLKNIQTMRHFETNDNIITLRDTQHYAPCDIPTVMMGSWLKKPFSMLFRLEDPSAVLPADKALDVCCDIAVRFFDDLDYLPNIEAGYIYRGTSYMSS